MQECNSLTRPRSLRGNRTQKHRRVLAAAMSSTAFAGVPAERPEKSAACAQIFLDARRFTFQITQVVQLGCTHLAATLHFH